MEEQQQVLDALALIHQDMLGVRSDLSWVIFVLSGIFAYTILIALVKRR